MMTKFRMLALSSVMAAYFSAPALATTLRLADTMPEGVPNAEGVAFFAEKVKEYSNGEMKVKIFSNGILGSERENVEQVQQGVLDLTRVGAATLDSFTDAVKPVTLPYVFESTDHLIRAMEGEAGKNLFAQMEQDNIYPLNYFVIGPRSFYTKDKPIVTPEDLKGMKVRVMSSQMAIKTMKALGASPTPIPMGDVYTALDQGVVDGAENAPQALIEHRHGEIAKYYSFDEHFNYPEFIIVSPVTMNRLSDKEKQILKRAATEATQYEITLAKQAIAAAVEQSKGKVAFNQVDKALFKQKVKPLYDEVIKQHPDAQPIIEQIQNAKLATN